MKVLIKTKEEIINIKNHIPDEWLNNNEQKTDVAYLFEEINNKEIIDKLPVKKEFLKIIYVDGALIINIRREDYNKSQINKIISHVLYQGMTFRNVNTARKLAL